MNDSEKLANLWKILHPDLVTIAYVPGDGWWVSIESPENYTKLTHLNPTLFPSARGDKTTIHTRPLTKADLLRQVKEQLANIWPYVKPGYDWLAADWGGGGKFSWYCYRNRPDRTGGSGWGSETPCTSLRGLHLPIPDGLEWHDLIFERPK